VFDISGDMRNHTRLLVELESVHFPVVAVWHGALHDGFLTVNVDNRHVTEAAVRHLARLGHRRIAFAGDPVLGDIQERQAAYEAYVAEHSLESHSGYVQHVRNSFSGGVAAFETLIALPEPPTAVAAATDVLAIGMLHAAFEHALVVPNDFSVVGFDDIPFAAMTTPALSTVRMPVEKMIHAALEMAVDKKLRNAGGRPEGVRVFRPSLVVRSSTTKPRRR